MEVVKKGQIVSYLFMAMCLCTAVSCRDRNLSLVPDRPSQSPDYFCTWNLQGYVASYSGGENTRAVMTEQSMFGHGKWEGWMDVFPKIRADMYFVMDDSWDIPSDINTGSNEYLGLTILDNTRFPSFEGTPAERLSKLNDMVQSYGWKGLGGWVCAQEADVDSDRDSIDTYWTERLKAAHEAGLGYWKVDWGRHGRNAEWRRNLTRLGHIHAPELYIEHAMQNEYIEFSDVFRTYDVENIVATPVTIRRVANLLPFKAKYRAKGIINCEDEPYIAAGLGCAIGVMRHPFNGELPNGKQDNVFPPVGRDYKNRLDEVVRGVRWHRIAMPFGVADDACIDTVKLYDYWVVHANETWVNRRVGDVVRETAPARISRNMPLPEVSGVSVDSVPYVMSSRYPNGATAVVTAERTIGRECVLCPADVTIQMSDLYRPIGVFGRYRRLVVSFPQEIRSDSIKVYAQDLASDRAVEITDQLIIEGNEIILRGELIDAIGLSAATSGDESLPGMVMQVFGK